MSTPGYVCHLVVMVAKYLEVTLTHSAVHPHVSIKVPFRYPMTPMCSRSTIRDDISPHFADKEREYAVLSATTSDVSRLNRFPLYIKGKERYAFEYGVFLLNKVTSLPVVVSLTNSCQNIVQLLNFAEQNPADVRNTLPNLRLLMRTYKVVPIRQQNYLLTHRTRTIKKASLPPAQSFARGHRRYPLQLAYHDTLAHARAVSSPCRRWPPCVWVNQFDTI